MTLTERVVKELTAVNVPRQSAKAAELAAIIRFAGEISVVGESAVLEIELEDQLVAQRVVASLEELYDIKAATHLVGPGSASRKPRIQVRLTQGVKELMRRLGLVTRSGHAVVGLPPQVISGTIADNEAAWRGAFMVAGSLTEPGRSSSLDVTCPCQEAALALVGCARRLGIVAKTKETRGADRVVVRDGDAIGALLTRMGAQTDRKSVV